MAVPQISPSCGCIVCGGAIERDAVVCVRCGADQRSGRRHQVIIERPGAAKADPSEDDRFFESERIGAGWGWWSLLRWEPLMFAQMCGVVAFYLIARGNAGLHRPFKVFALAYLVVALLLVVLDALSNSETEDFVFDLFMPHGGLRFLLNAENAYFLSMLACALAACSLMLGL